MSKRSTSSDLSRRDFLRLTGVIAAGLLVNGCQPEQAAHSATQVATQPAANKPSVAIAQARTYERSTIESQIQTLINQLGGLGDVVKPGDTVAIKPNLTGGTSSQRVPGVTPEDSFVTHPEVVRALVKQVKDAGAKEIFIVESVYEWASYIEWGYEAIASDLGVTLIDLNEAKPYADFKEKLVGAAHFIYE